MSLYSIEKFISNIVKLRNHFFLTLININGGLPISTCTIVEPQGPILLITLPLDNIYKLIGLAIPDGSFREFIKKLFDPIGFPIIIIGFIILITFILIWFIKDFIFLAARRAAWKLEEIVEPAILEVAKAMWKQSAGYRLEQNRKRLKEILLERQKKEENAQLKKDSENLKNRIDPFCRYKLQIEIPPKKFIIKTEHKILPSPKNNPFN